MIDLFAKWRYCVAGVFALPVLLFAFQQPAADYLFGQGLAAKSEWRLDDAVGYFDWALRLDRNFAEARLEKGLCHQLRGEFLVSQRELDRLIEEPVEDAALRARALDAAGVNRFSASEPDAAREAHMQSLALARELGDRQLEAHALVGLSRVSYHLGGRVDEALDYLRQAHQIGLETGDGIVQAHALRNMGVVYWWFKNEFERALVDYYEPALELYRRHGDLHGEAVMLSNIAHVHFSRGDFLEFVRYQSESLDIKRRVGDLAGQCDSYAALGAMYGVMRNARKAHEYYSRSLETSQRIGYRLTQNDVESLLAQTSVDVGEYDRAIAIFTRLLESEPRDTVLSKYRRVWLGRCHALTGEPEVALGHFEKALETERAVPDTNSGVGIRALMAEAYVDLRDFETAARMLAEAERVGQVPGEKWWAGEILIKLGLAKLAEAEGRLDDATGYLLQAAEIETRVMGSSETPFLQGREVRIYDRLFTLLLEPSSGRVAAGGARPEEVAFRTLEQLRYRAFRDFVVTLDRAKHRPEARRAAEARALERIEQLSARLKERESPAAWRDLRQAYSDYEDLVLRSELGRRPYQLVREARPADLREVQRALDPQTALVEYLMAGDRVYALVATRSALRSVVLPVGTRNLAAKVKLFRSLVFDEAAAGSAWRPVAADLRRVLVEPIEQTGALGGIGRLAIVPFGFLHDLPFAALTRVEGGRERFLVEDHSIVLVPSATFLARSLERTARAPSLDRAVVSFGRNESDEEGLSPLGSAVDEARAVADAYQGEARFGAEASETELKRLARAFRYIHFATHAVSEPQMPLLARLKLGATPEDDGNLSVREIFDLELDAEMVTLGACRSGQSYSASGSDVGELDRIGLIEAFLHGGARSVTASLLPIGDAPTTEFMKSFYRNLRSKDKAEAMAATQRAMLRGELFHTGSDRSRTLAHPRYWAPFVLVGDYR